jgi:hypothetical protein
MTKNLVGQPLGQEFASLLGVLWSRQKDTYMADKFQLVFFTTTAFTLLNFGTATAIATMLPETKSAIVTELYNTSIKLFTAGVGAIIGLLGGHAI